MDTEIGVFKPLKMVQSLDDMLSRIKIELSFEFCKRNKVAKCHWIQVSQREDIFIRGAQKK